MHAAKKFESAHNKSKEITFFVQAIDIFINKRFFHSSSLLNETIKFYRRHMLRVYAYICQSTWIWSARRFSKGIERCFILPDPFDFYLGALFALFEELGNKRSPAQSSHIHFTDDIQKVCTALYAHSHTHITTKFYAKYAPDNWMKCSLICFFPRRKENLISLSIRRLNVVIFRSGVGLLKVESLEK